MAGAKTILLIEDDREISATLSGVLDAAGYSVRTAPNGIEGQKRVEEERPDLIITDMMMPRMGGFPVLEFLQTLPDAPPVIMITANEGGRHKAFAEAMGVSTYLRKPFAMDVLLEAVDRALREREARDGPTADKTVSGAARTASTDDGTSTGTGKIAKASPAKAATKPMTAVGDGSDRLRRAVREKTAKKDEEE